MPSWVEFRLACQGLYRLALLDRSFLGLFDRSTAGALRSFALAVPLLPLYLWLISLNIDQSVPDTATCLAAKGVGYIYGWILFPFAILIAARLLDRDNEAVGCIAIYNWTSVLWIALQLPPAALDALSIAPDLAALLSLAIFVASLVIEGFLFVVCMRLAIWQSALLVAIDVVLSQGVIWPVSTALGCAPLT
jgi:hypothetical protein